MNSSLVVARSQLLGINSRGGLDDNCVVVSPALIEMGGGGHDFTALSEVVS